MFWRIVKIFLGFSVICFAFFLAINQGIHSKAQSRIYTDVATIPPAEVVIVLGAKVYSSGRMSDMFVDRAQTALEIYQAGKVSKILISGDHGQENYDEVNAAKQFFLDNQVPNEDIFLDHAGFDTYDSMYRARDVFAVKKAIIATQEFHLPRALYICEELGIEAYGAKSDKQSYVKIGQAENREKLANIKAFFNILFKSKPKYLGEQIPITGDGQLSWD